MQILRFLDQVTTLLAKQNLALAHPVTSNDNIIKTAFIYQSAGPLYWNVLKLRILREKKKAYLEKA